MHTKIVRATQQTRDVDTIGTGLMLGRRRRRRDNIQPASGKRIVFAGMIRN